MTEQATGEPTVEPAVRRAPYAVRQPWRLGSRGRAWFDRALVAALLLPLLVVVPASGPPIRSLVLSGLMIVPLWWRRRAPLLVTATVAAICLAQVVVLDVPVWGQVAVPVAVYTVASLRPLLPALTVIALGFVGAVVAALDWLGDAPPPSLPTLVGWIVPIATIVVAAWALGTAARIRRAYVESLVAYGEQVEREAAQRVALAASDERARIAREMHDVVAHGLSVIVVQADGARYAAAADPAVATATLERIATTGREALGDMRQLLGLLRAHPGSGETGTQPLPGLDDVPDLVSAAGAEADLLGLEADVPSALALTTYRVVQESLTNVRKHAGPDARPRVRVAVGPSDIQVSVTDDGRGAATDPATNPATNPAEPGHGLVGMRERVGLHGGTVSAGPRPGGGFLVEATLPR